jgi:hypothetical protein
LHQNFSWQVQGNMIKTLNILAPKKWTNFIAFSFSFKNQFLGLISQKKHVE